MTPTEERIAKLRLLLARVRERRRFASEPPPQYVDLEAIGAEISRETRAPSREPPMPVVTPSMLAPPPPRPSAKPPAPDWSSTPEDASLDRSIVEVTEVAVRRVVPPPLPPLPSFGTMTSHAKPPPLPEPEPSQVRAINPAPGDVIELDLEPEPDGASVVPPAPISTREPESSPPPAEDVFESRSRLVSAPPIDADDDDLVVPGSERTIQETPDELSIGDRETAIYDEPAPSSSRRPISIEAKMTEDDDAAPLHMAPPESGKLPAAVPAIDLAFDAAIIRRPIETPMPLTYRPATTPPPPPPAPPLPAVAIPPSAPRIASAVPAPLSPAVVSSAARTERDSNVARAVAPTGAHVAVFVGRAPPGLSSVTFGELLDATLGL